MTPEVFTITDKIDENGETFTLHLEPKIPLATSFKPGQFTMLYHFGFGEVPMSISGSPSDTQGYTHTIHGVGSVTHALKHLSVGDEVGIRGPFGKGWPVEQAAGRSVLVIAGGLGLAPLRPLIYKLLETDSEPNANHKAVDSQLFYGAKTPKHIIYRDELAAWSKQLTLKTCVDIPDSTWQGSVCNVTELLKNATIDVENTVAFICGPEIMMEFAIKELLQKKLPASAIYLSMERNMKCATGHCGRCQWGPQFVCKNGPVFCYEDIQSWFQLKNI